jgi:hypothetical protein
MPLRNTWTARHAATGVSERRRSRRREDRSGPHRAPLGMERRLTGVSPVPLRQLQPGAVVRARIPFAQPTDGDKVRPALVVRCSQRPLVVVPIHSAKWNLRQARWLPVPESIAESLARASQFAPRLVELDRMEVIEVLGHPVPADERDATCPSASALINLVARWAQLGQSGPGRAVPRVR